MNDKLYRQLHHLAGKTTKLLILYLLIICCIVDIEGTETPGNYILNCL